MGAEAALHGSRKANSQDEAAAATAETKQSHHPCLAIKNLAICGIETDMGKEQPNNFRNVQDSHYGAEIKMRESAKPKLRSYLVDLCAEEDNFSPTRPSTSISWKERLKALDRVKSPKTIRK